MDGMLPGRALCLAGRAEQPSACAQGDVNSAARWWPGDQQSSRPGMTQRSGLWAALRVTDFKHLP